MSVTQAQLKQHFLNLGEKGAIYVWGANGQIITEELMEYLYKTFGNSKYNKAYYDNKLKEGEGKPGADCSGVLKEISGYDTTASGYYKKCTEKGAISSIPTNKVCLVFKVDSDLDITHVGCYTGDGYVSEMASSALNYQRKPLNGNGWDLWGMPDFISNPNTVMSSNTTSAKKYYPRYMGVSNSLDTILKEIGVPSEYIKDKKSESWAVRKPLAIANGISNYAGTAAQNSTLKKLARSGKLVKVEETVDDGTYYPKYTGTSSSLDVILEAIGVPSEYIGNYEKRKPLAQANGINNYTGTSAQNSTLKKLAKNGTLKRV